MEDQNEFRNKRRLITIQTSIQRQDSETEPLNHTPHTQGQHLTPQVKHCGIRIAHKMSKIENFFTRSI